jgi:hypothetical protein
MIMEVKFTKGMVNEAKSSIGNRPKNRDVDDNRNWVIVRLEVGASIGTRMKMNE